MFCPQIPEKYKPRLKKAPVIFRKQVLIGCGVSILPNVTLGEGSIVGAHSLVTEDTLPWSIYAGIPAKKIGDASRDMLKFREQFLEEYNRG